MSPRLRALLPFLLDLALPIAAYVLLHTAAGLSAFWALAIGGLATMASTTITTVRRRKLDAFGILVAAEVALSVALLFVSRDPRVLLIKPAFYFAVAGAYALATLMTGTPLAYETGRPFATRGDPALIAAYNRAYTGSDAFRRAIRTVTAAWGACFLADAALRVLIVVSFPPAQVADSLVLSQAPLVVLLVAAIVFTRVRMRRVRHVLTGERAGGTFRTAGGR